MNKALIIGNLTKTPELRTTKTGVSVCTFTVAVNRRRREGQEPEADFFRVTVWRQLGELCEKYLAKGRKVAVIGEVSVSTYEKDGKTYANLEITADSVEFLSPKEHEQETAQQQAPASQFVEVDSEELPF